MKTLMKLALTGLFLTIFTLSQAQIKPGYKFGMNISTILLKTGVPVEKPDMPIGFHFGGIIDIPLNDFLSFQPALLLSAKGANFSIDSADFSLSPVYIEIPMNAVCNIGTGSVKPFLFVGPYVAIGLGGYKLPNGGEIQNLRFGSDHDLKLFDLGFNFGTGININGFCITAQYGIGLANISTIAAEMKNRVIGISISSILTVR